MKRAQPMDAVIKKKELHVSGQVLAFISNRAVHLLGDARRARHQDQRLTLFRPPDGSSAGARIRIPRDTEIEAP